MKRVIGIIIGLIVLSICLFISLPFIGYFVNLELLKYILIRILIFLLACFILRWIFHVEEQILLLKDIRNQLWAQSKKIDRIADATEENNRFYLQEKIKRPDPQARPPERRGMKT